MRPHLNPMFHTVTLCLLVSAAQADIVRGPYLQDPRPDRMTVVIETDSEQTCSVSWGDGLSNQTPLQADGIHHQAILEGLQPSTCYPYRVECAGVPTSPGSLCGAPEGDEPFRFVVLGDTRSDAQAHAAVMQAVAAEGVDFFINTGDLVTDGTDEADWASFFEIEGGLLRDLPLVPVVGNHDESNGEIPIYARLFAPPSESSASENYYSFRYGNSKFLVLDNQAAFLGRPEDDSAEGRWLMSELQSLQDDPGHVHTFVLVHANMYSADDGRTGDEGLRQWRDLFRAHGVDVVFSGHDHHYARGEADNGLPFVVAGGGGAPLYDFRPGFETAGRPLEVSVWGWLPEPGDKAFTLIWTRKIHHYVVVEVQGGRLEACAKAVIPGADGPGVAFDCWSSGPRLPDPQADDPSPASSGCSTAPTGPFAGIWLLAMGWLLRPGRRRRRAWVNILTIGCLFGATGICRAQPAVVEPAPDSPSATLRFSIHDGSLEARTDESGAWTLSIAPKERWESVGRAVHGPQRLADSVFLCIDTALFEIDALHGNVLRRLPLPGACQALVIQDDQVQITVGDTPGAAAGESAGDNPGETAGEQGWKVDYRVAPGRGQIPFFAFPTGKPGLGLFERKQAERLLVPANEPAERRTFLEEPTRQPQVEAAIAELTALAKQDPTNPWYDFFRAEYLDALGREDDARDAVQACLNHPPDSDYTLLGLASRIDMFDPALGQQAWERGMAFLLRHGYEPELTFSLLGVVASLGKPMRESLDLTDAADRRWLEDRARRLIDLAPHPEGSASFYQALADAAELAGDIQAATLWQQRTEQARPYEVFAPVGDEVRFVGYWLNAFLAVLLSLALALLVKTLRTFSSRYAGDAGILLRFNPVSRWSRGELLGLLGGFGLCLWLAVKVVAGVVIIGVTAQVPMNVALGNLGHPAALAYLKDLQQPDGQIAPGGARFLQALALQQAGQWDEAAAIYVDLPFPQAQVNLGVIRARQGDRAAAEHLWAQALTTDPSQAEAAHNLGRPADSLRVQRAKRFGLTEPLLAMPTVPMWSALWQAKASQHEELAGGDPVTALLSLSAQSEGMGLGLGGQGWTAMAWLLVVAAVLSLLALLASIRRPPILPPTWGRSGWLLGSLLPGAARQYWLFWPLVLGAFVYMMLGAWVLGSTNGTSSNLLDAIASPAFNRYFGAGVPVVDPLKHALDQLCRWPSILGVFLANLVFVFVAERLRPDPAGWFARRERAAKS